jgi:hypothetical protein
VLRKVKEKKLLPHETNEIKFCDIWKIFQYLGVILGEDNSHQIDLQGTIKKCQKNILYATNFLKIKTYLKN